MFSYNYTCSFSRLKQMFNSNSVPYSWPLCIYKTIIKASMSEPHTSNQTGFLNFCVAGWLANKCCYNCSGSASALAVQLLLFCVCTQTYQYGLNPTAPCVHTLLFCLTCDRAHTCTCTCVYTHNLCSGWWM